MAMREELVQEIVKRYGQAPRQDKGLILDEFVALTGYHRKHAVRVLNGHETGGSSTRVSRCIYDQAVREALVVVWETGDRICGKRLKAVLPSLVQSLERHGHLSLDEEVRERLLRVSASTIDRLLAPVRTHARGHRRRATRNSGLRQRIRVRTFADWGDPPPGFMEMDLVAHNGGSVAGSHLHTLVLTDIASGWTECMALLVREQTLVVEAVEVTRTQLPFTLAGLDTDNGGEFINESLLDYCTDRGLEFTRSRPYRKNDQAWIEQKNGAVVRRLVGYARLEGLEVAQTLAQLYQVARRYVNFFQPSFKLLSKEREGARVHKHYAPPATPCERLLACERLSEAHKRSLRELGEGLDPVSLLRTLRDLQATLAALAAGNAVGSVSQTSLEQFLAQLPRLWQEGEVRATHRRAPRSPRTWRTRIDPFESVWPTLQNWLEADPSITAKDLFGRLVEQHPGTYTSGQLRTLQRRVSEWRRYVAKRLIFESSTPTTPVDCVRDGG